MTRSLRRWTTFLCLAGFLFAQLTLVAYACPLRAPAPLPVATADAEGGHDIDRCPGHAPSRAPDAGALCEVHCQGQNGVPAGAGVVVPPLVLAPFPVVLAFDAQTIRTSLVARTPLAANAAAPPLAQQFCRFLI